jgi:DDHD domain
MPTVNQATIEDSSNGAPELFPWFFYSSPVDIDDALAIAPVPGSFEASWTKLSPRPFSESDNKALEAAWHAWPSEGNSKASVLVIGAKEMGQPSPQSDQSTSPGNAEHPADPSPAVVASDKTDFHEKSGFKDQLETAGENEGDTLNHNAVPLHATSSQTTKKVAVGISKLYMVKLPALKMLPIYWSPGNDVATVTRGTWFFKDTMYPVESEIGSKLELGYIQNSPWSQGWGDRLSKAVEQGIDGDQTFLHPLGLEEDGGEVSQGADRHAIIKPYLNSLVCYEDESNAFLLRPGLEQSQFYRLRSLSKIVGGRVGIHVVRGFDPEAWERLHPLSKKPVAPGDNPESSSATTEEKIVNKDSELGEVRDLVFVVHGIGQKLSLRFEGFSFTHAANSLRRLVSTDLLNPAVRKGLRDNFGGIAILPINWRSNFNFGGGGAIMTGQHLKPSDRSGHLTLDEITPQSIPAVRSLISDVLLDIPFYMSPHKEKMLEAVIKEANRIYRLWCHNNPGFQERGRVHLIGHSLGSALCLDILSRQPTFVTPFEENAKVLTKHLEFDTTNLFFVGSPVGFFLLLGGGKLIPRKGRSKPSIGLDEENSKEVTGVEGTYGCIAVDNIYNIMHYDDPIAYRVNAAVDVEHTKLLKVAEVPSATVSWRDTFSTAAQSIKQGISVLPFMAGKAESDANSSSSEDRKIHQIFTTAEKKFLLLNDNGQVDYFLKASEGPDIQYLNMLWAHGSYWSNLDFARLLVTEIGREPGVENAFAAMKAVKIPPAAESASVIV